jgi:tRNA(Ile)-lysidine synthase
MEAIRDDLFIRPLLGITRTEIETYCVKNNLNPRMDLSNNEAIFTRNKIRLELIPYIEKNYNENLTDSLFRLSKIAAEDKSYFNMVVENFITNHVKFSKAESSKLAISSSQELANSALQELANSSSQELANSGLQEILNKESQNLSNKNTTAEFSIQTFNLEHLAIRKKILLKLAEIISKAEDISYINLESGIKFLEAGKTSKKLEFPNGIIIKISYDTAFLKLTPTELESSKVELTIEKNKDGGMYNEAAYEITKVGKLVEKVINNMEIKDLNENDNIKYFDYDSVSKDNLKLVLRNRRAGDYIKPLGMKGTKSIKELFIDEKVPKDERDKILLVCLGAKVMWIISSRINEDYKVTKDTKQVLMLEYIKQV